MEISQSKKDVPGAVALPDESFRDHLATVDAKGRRKWVFAQQPSGKWYRLRTYISLGFFVLFFALPFVYVHGQPLFLFNIPNARFIIFGKVFWPQDFFIFGLTMVTFIVFIILFTAAFGRLFCGWVCPQTIFMEMLFRKVEYAILGDAAKQRAARSGPATAGGQFRVILQAFVCWGLPFTIANTFVCCMIGVGDL